MANKFIMNVLATLRNGMSKFLCNLSKLKFLFEPIDMTTSIRMMDTIENAIAKFEPRARDVVVEITPLEDQNTFKIDITARMDESNRDIVLDTTLEKIR